MATTREISQIEVRGAKEHNLKNIDIDIPKKSLVVFTGVSGSGKSSLVFDTIYAEGQRRYVESLSSYARQFLGQMEKPKYETIRGLSPTIAIEQKAASKNPRSTVGTITEVYDYLRVFFARLGTQFCPKCGSEVGRGDANSMVQQIVKHPEGTKILLLAPILENKKGEHRDLIKKLRADGYSRLRVDGVVLNSSDVQTLAKHKKHNLEVVVDRLVVAKSKSFLSRLTDSVEQGLKVGSGQIIVHVLDREDIRMSEERSCCGMAFPQLEPALFSFNSPQGMCGECNGIGTSVTMDEKKLVADSNLTIAEGAVIPWKGFFKNGKPKTDSWGWRRIQALNKEYGIDWKTPWKKMPRQHKRIILKGDPGKELTLKWKSKKGNGSWTIDVDGLLDRLMRRYQQTQSEAMKNYYSQFMSTQQCPSCHGQRLRTEPLHVKFDGKSISDVVQMTIGEAHDWITKVKLNAQQKIIADELVKEIKNRLKFLVNVGLNYLSMNRKGPTLSGGEAQRIRLASQIGTELTGVLYVLDEPSIGLHQRDNQKLLNTLEHLRNIGNSVLVVEHDQDTMLASDWLVDIGPGAGRLGGQVVYSGPPKEIAKSKTSLTGKYLSGGSHIPVPPSTREFSKSIKIIGANQNNLKNVDAEIPLEVITCVTGVSGAGKSTLINQILYPALAQKLHGTEVEAGHYKKITGLSEIDKVVNIDQKPIGRTPRSNPATYTKLFDHIRGLFAELPESRQRGYQKGRFSFNVKGGRCEQCQGDGFVRVEMHFLADVFVPCKSCQGKRFNPATLEVQFKGHSIADILELSVAEACELFKNHKQILNILQTLSAVGLNYVKLGQSATTLSGGEAQRIKLSRELAKLQTGRTLYILDEPTTGLHFEDIKNLLEVLQKLADAGNTVVIIEHNLDVVRAADWIIDMGPEGGSKGGEIIFTGTPKQIKKFKKSYTGKFL